MAIDLVLDQPVGSARATRVGPLGKVTVGHRRITAGETKLVRKTDGLWYLGEDRYLELRIEASGSDAGKPVEVKFTKPWTKASPSDKSASVRLYGDRLYGAGRWVATDEDDNRCWVAEDTGYAHDGLVISAA